MIQNAIMRSPNNRPKTSDGIAIIDLDAMKVGNSQTNMKAVVRKQMKRFMENWQDNAEAKSIFEEIVPADVRKSS